MRSSHLAAAGLILAAAWARPIAAQDAAGAQDSLASALGRVQWRSLGPMYIGGRINDIAASTPGSSPEQPSGTVMYVVGTGGVFGTTNAGHTWTPLFDAEPVATAHRVAVAPSDARVVWVGTGDATEFVHAMASGNGVYKSVDAGHTWTHMGLDSTAIIGRIAIDPRDANTVYVAAMGPMARRSRARGVYKTTDGGQHWTQLLAVDEWTGAIDLALDPHDPNTLYAAMWQASGTPARFIDNGPESGVYKSTDGGATWRKIDRGLPTNGYLGRIGLAPSPARAGLVYALVAAPDSTGDTEYYYSSVVVYRSEDGGESWQRGAALLSSRYYTFGIVADPHMADRVYLVTGSLCVSNDGGRTTHTIPPDESRVHVTDNGGDMHAFWVDPAHTDHLVLGNDIGLYETHDGGTSWRHTTNLSVGQFRAVAVDRAQPFYHVYGESQDHPGIGGPSRTRAPYGITNSDWRWLPSPEAGPIVTDPTDTTIAYTTAWAARGIERIHLPTRQLARIDPTGGWWRTEGFSWNHTIPLALSPHDPRTVYTGATKLLRSRDRGDRWEAASGRLTQPVPDSVMVMGRRVAYYGVHPAYHTLSTIAESPVARGTIYVGTHDGLLHVTRDGGRTWARLDLPSGAPAGVMISRVLASRNGAGTAYLTVNGGLAGDYGPYVFTTTDFGRHWSRADAGLPPLASVWAIIEHPRTPRLLFLGTDVGVFVSVDAGRRWTTLRGANLPAVQVRDLAIQPDANDLAIATYGRGLWVLDDVTPIERLAREAATDAPVPQLFPIRDALQLHDGNDAYDETIMYGLDATPNPAPVIVSSWMPAGAAATRWALEIVDVAGERVHLAQLDSVPGLGRVTWDLRIPFGASATGGYVQTAAALPGLYRARLRAGTVNDSTQSLSVPPGREAGPIAERMFHVRADPAIRATAAEIALIRAARRRVRALGAELHAVVELATQLSTAPDSVTRATAAAALALNTPSAYGKWSDLVIAPDHPRSVAEALSILRDELAELTTLGPWVGMGDAMDALEREIVRHRRALERARASARSARMLH